MYVNYGRMEDFQLLASMNISLSGCVCIARYGMIFRGSKVRHCVFIQYVCTYGYSQVCYVPELCGVCDHTHLSLL